ncbi:MAG: DNA topoisomerase IV subunit A [Proteobacteria bacterium]|nr:DNA topoisomerase IV subunit A [Pseudomonadota bacterium]
MAKKESEIVNVDFSEALSERYFAYAMSTITSRSLPDVRDGLKPVHRRLLYAMLQLKLEPTSGYKKCARVVGDVIGKYHPHGDIAVYDTMVRLAQSFSVRYPLVDGQGNFGSVDGDNAAAMRYTEARLTEVALALMQDIESDTVNFRPTYDGSESEPVVMPSAFPNLLANGSEGIAVGMATSVPPHNVGEICDALLHLIKSPNSHLSTLVDCMPGPDFPTGGVLVEPKENILKAYETGRGSFRLRARWEKEELSHGLYQIVITEIPYQVQKSKLIEKLAEAFKAKKLALLGNIRDESTEDIRIILEPKSRTVKPEMLMESLFKLTDLEVRIQLNMNVLDAKGSPQVMDLREVLRAFLDHRHEVLERKAKFRLGKIDHRLEILDGFLVCYLNLDEVIRIIREEDEPKAVMMKKWKLSDVQVDAILNMRLRSLRRLEEIEIKTEHAKLSAEKKELKALLASEDKRWAAIAEEIKLTKQKFGAKTALGKRRTSFGDAPTTDVVSIEAFVEKEPITVILSEQGWIRAHKGHLEEVDDLKFKEGDALLLTIKAQTTDKLLVFATDGRCFTIGCDKLPGGKGMGEPVRLMIDLPQEHAILSLRVFEAGKKYLVASSAGKGFIVKSDDVVAQTRQGKQVMNLDNAKMIVATPAEGDAVAVVGDNRKLLVFMLNEIPEMKRGAGVQLQKYKDGGLSDAKCFTLKEGLTWQLGQNTRNEASMTEWMGKRAGAGKMPPNGFPKTNKFS